MNTKFVLWSRINRQYSDWEIKEINRKLIGSITDMVQCYKANPSTNDGGKALSVIPLPIKIVQSSRNDETRKVWSFFSYKQESFTRWILSLEFDCELTEEQINIWRYIKMGIFMEKRFCGLLGNG